MNEEKTKHLISQICYELSLDDELHHLFPNKTLPNHSGKLFSSRFSVHRDLSVISITSFKVQL